MAKATTDLGIGGRVRALREAAGWTQRDLDKASGVDQGQISKIELGMIQLPRTPTVSALAQAFGVTMESLLGERDHEVSDDYWQELRANVTRLDGHQQAWLLSLSRRLRTERLVLSGEPSGGTVLLQPPVPAASPAPRRKQRRP